MKLQNIIYPSVKNCTEESLYFRKEGDVQYSFADSCITLAKDARVDFDTYFNGCSVGKWYKYTNAAQIKLSVKVKGKLKITLFCKEKQAGRIITKVVEEFYCDTEAEVKDIACAFDTENMQGMFAFNILALEENAEFYGGYYYTELPEELVRKVRIAIVICTFKREKYVYKNMQMLEEAFLNNANSELYENLEVIISDNAQSLDQTRLLNEKIHVYKNKNVGGAGGFTRGLIEAMNLSENNAFTHVLLMDDDVVIQPESIYRTYALLRLLKEEYIDTYVGGAMLRTDLQWFQTESGAIWNAGRLISHKQRLDLRKVDACLYNEIEEKCEFNAWWYCTVPMQFVRKDNLPLPIFIRGDDVEYGLRNMKHLILMNGICVWHEPFEFKYSSSMYYYIFRNRLIDNAVRGLRYTEKEFLKEFASQYIREIFLLRYKNARLLLEGAHDFLKGIDWLKQQDGEILNKEIMSRGYRLQYVDELPIPFTYPAFEASLHFKERDNRKKQAVRRLTGNGFLARANKTVVVPVNEACVGHFYKAGAALNYDLSSKKGFVTYRNRKEMIQLLREYLKLSRAVKKNYKKVVEEYRNRKDEITNIQFWKGYLDL